MNLPSIGGRPSSGPSASLLLVAATLATADLAAAETITVTLRGSYIETIQSSGVTVPRADLRSGVSSGESNQHAVGTPIRSADGRNLESYFIRNGTAPTWDIEFGAWSPGAGPAADFFLFEIGGNDTVNVRPRFANGSFGASVAITGWTPTDVVVDGGPNAGQRAFGLGFRFEDLKRANGANLTPGDQVIGLRVESSGIDGAAFLLRDPGTNAGSDGDGSASILPSVPSVSAPMEVIFQGPWESETGVSPNPFLDYRLIVTFQGPGGRVVRVPGFFDADGAGGDVGNLWKARFLPPIYGSWTATATMRSGPQVAISLNPGAGTPVSAVNGSSITFTVEGVPENETGFFRVGTLRNVGKHYRKFEHGSYFVKAGANGPENFLAVRGLDDATKSGGVGNLHSYATHRSDWNAGDPILDPEGGAEDGKGVIGALNYLSESGVNSLFLMVMNLGGDGKDVYPFLGPRRRSFEKTHYDTSRLRQWNAIFEHAQRKGISLSLVFNETEIENETWLDNGQLGVERKLFYREMIGRFGHLPAIRWNVCEENDYPIPTLASFANYITALDSDEHSIAIHNNPNDLGLFQALSNNPNFDSASLQFDPNQANYQVEQVRQWTAQTGRPWVVAADEQQPWQTGVTDNNSTDTRKRILYDALFSGGGVEFYLGWHSLPLGGDLTLEDFRTRDSMWTNVKHARTFMEDHLPFWEMSPIDSLVRNEDGSFGGAEVYALLGEIYAIYYPNASSTGQINLPAMNGLFRVEWFNPRTGEFVGNPTILGNSGGWTNVGPPPTQAGEDWVALVRKQEPLSARFLSGSVSSFAIQILELRPGTPFAGRNYFMLSSLSGTSEGFLLAGTHVPINFDRWTRYGIGDSQGLFFDNHIGVLDSAGSATIRVKLNPAFAGGLIGQTMYHCAVLTQPYDFASNVVTFQVLP